MKKSRLKNKRLVSERTALQKRRGKQAHEPTFSLDDYSGYSNFYGQGGGSSGSGGGYGYDDYDNYKDELGYDVDELAADQEFEDEVDVDDEDLGEGRVFRMTERVLRRHVRRILLEQLEQEELEFSPGSIDEMDNAIATNEKEALEASDPTRIEMYQADALKLTDIKNMAIDEKAAGETMGSSQLRDMISRIDTVVREQIPQEIYSWIIGEDY